LKPGNNADMSIRLNRVIIIIIKIIWRLSKEKFIDFRYLFVLILRFWNVCDYFIIRARYVYLTNYKKCRTYNSLQVLFFTFFFCQINSFVVTACRNRAFIVCPSTGISDSNVYTNETGKRQMILMMMMMTPRNKRKILKRNSRIHKL
jgi:hypothetical protein